MTKTKPELKACPDAKTQARWILKDVVGLTWDDDTKSINMTPRSFVLCVQAAIARNSSTFEPKVLEDANWYAKVDKNLSAVEKTLAVKQSVIDDALSETLRMAHAILNPTSINDRSKLLVSLARDGYLKTLITHASNHDAMEDELEAVKINASHLRSLNELRNQEIAAYEIALQKKVVEKVTEQKFEKCLNQMIGEIVKRCNGFHQESVVKVIIEFMKMSKNGIKIIDGANHD